MARRDRPIMHSDVRKAVAYGAGAYTGYQLGSRYPGLVGKFFAVLAGLGLAVALVFVLFGLGMAAMVLAYPLALAIALIAPEVAVRRTTWPMAFGYSLFLWAMGVLISGGSLVWAFVLLGVMGGMGSLTLLLGIPLTMFVLIGLPFWMLARQRRRIRATPLPAVAPPLQQEGGSL